MSDRIGPTFASELAAAGCGAGVSWICADGTLIFNPDLSADYIAKVQAVMAAHVPFPPPTLAQSQAAASAAVDAKRDTILTGGFSHDFGSPNGVKVLQTRESDETNWLTLQGSCLAAVAAGQGATVGAVIRTADNVNISLSYSDCLQVMLAMSAWGAAVYAASWKLKDAIAAATDQATLAAIDVTAGWPANP